MSGKYVPPHLRNAASETVASDRRISERPSDSRGFVPTSTTGPASSSSQREPVAAPTNSRWSSFDEPAPAPAYPERGSGYQDRGYPDRGSKPSFFDRSGGDRPRSGFGDRPRSDGYSGGGSGTNSMGFHGDERPNQRIENELFHTGESQVAGINFDKVHLY